MQGRCIGQKVPEEIGAVDPSRHRRMEPSLPASAFCGSVGKNAKRKEESVALQLLELLLGLLRETRRRAGRGAGEPAVAEAVAERQPLDEDARHHAGPTLSMQMDGMQ